MLRYPVHCLHRTLVPTLLLLVTAGCATPAVSPDPSHQTAFDAGCETGRAEGARERYLEAVQTPRIDIDRYADDEGYRRSWDAGFWQCFQRTMRLSTQGARTRTGSGVAYDETRARIRVDRYIRDALRAR